MPTEVGWGHNYYYPRAILHADGDSFFAACEVASKPWLKGKPVVTGKERGIVSAATYEAKALGVSRGIALKDARRICPELVVIDSDYETYGLYSRRMYDIVRRYTPVVEEYGIDECFADLTGLRRTFHMSYEDIARKIQEELTQELNITFGVGLAATKTLAKVGSKHRKPNGFTPIPLTDKDTFLAATEIEKIWGIGPNTASYLKKYGVATALDFAGKSERWVKGMVTKPIFEVWQELNGILVHELVTENKESYQSIQKTRTFRPASNDPAFILAQLSKNVEGACRKARRFNLSAGRLSFFLKTQNFRYRVVEVTLSRPTSIPSDLSTVIEEQLPRLLRPGERYRATGVTLGGLVEHAETQLDLFTSPEKLAGALRLYEKIDTLTDRFGTDAVYLASSMKAIAKETDEEDHFEYGTSASLAKDAAQRFSGRSKKKLFSMPYLGDVG